MRREVRTYLPRATRLSCPKRLRVPYLQCAPEPRDSAARSASESPISNAPQSHPTQRAASQAPPPSPKPAPACAHPKQWKRNQSERRGSEGCGSRKRCGDSSVSFITHEGRGSRKRWRCPRCPRRWPGPPCCSARAPPLRDERYGTREAFITHKAMAHTPCCSARAPPLPHTPCCSARAPPLPHTLVAQHVPPLVADIYMKYQCHRCAPLLMALISFPWLLCC